MKINIVDISNLAQREVQDKAGYCFILLLLYL